MNKQLSLLPESRFKQIQPTNKTQDTSVGKRSNADGYTNWWKLSEQEKEMGLAGVRAIRNILENTRPLVTNPYAKAS